MSTEDNKAVDLAELKKNIQDAFEKRDKYAVSMGRVSYLSVLNLCKESCIPTTGNCISCIDTSVGGTHVSVDFTDCEVISMKHLPESFCKEVRKLKAMPESLIASLPPGMQAQIRKVKQQFSN